MITFTDQLFFLQYKPIFFIQFIQILFLKVILNLICIKWVKRLWKIDSFLIRIIYRWFLRLRIIILILLFTILRLPRIKVLALFSIIWARIILWKRVRISILFLIILFWLSRFYLGHFLFGHLFIMDYFYVSMIFLIFYLLYIFISNLSVIAGLLASFYTI